MVASVVVLNPKLVAEGPTGNIEMSIPPPHPHSHSDMDEEDLYSRLKSLERQMEFIDIQEEYVKDKKKNLKRELLRAQEEVKRIQSVPLVIG